MDRVTTEETLFAAFQRVDSSHSCARGQNLCEPEGPENLTKLHGR